MERRDAVEARELSEGTEDLRERCDEADGRADRVDTLPGILLEIEDEATVCLFCVKTWCGILIWRVGRLGKDVNMTTDGAND